MAPSLASSFSAFANVSAPDEKSALDQPGQAARVKENDELMSNGSIEGVTERSGQWDRYNRTLRERMGENGKKSGRMDIAFLELLNEIDRLNVEIKALDDRIIEIEAGLIAEFGEDYLEDMALMYLDEDQISGFEGMTAQEREDAIIEALKTKMLDENGEIKPEYMGLEIAELVKAQADRDSMIEQHNDRGAELVGMARTGEIEGMQNDDSTIDALAREIEKIEVDGVLQTDPEVTDELNVAMDKQTDIEVASSEATGLSWNTFGQG